MDNAHLASKPAVSTAKVFFSGNSQAVRLPKQHRFTTDTVSITPTSDGGLLLKPIANTPTRGEKLLALLSDFDDAFIDGLASDDAPMQDREAL